MQDNVTQGWEIFCDTSYFDMWCIRKEGDKRWGAGVHVISQDGAEAVRDYIIASTTAQTEAVQKLVEALEKAVAFYDNLSRPHDEGEAKLLDEMAAALAARRESQP